MAEPGFETRSPECESEFLRLWAVHVKRFGWLLKARWVWNSTGMKGRRKRKIPDKTRRPTASSGTIPTCENLFALVGGEQTNHYNNAATLSTGDCHNHLARSARLPTLSSSSSHPHIFFFFPFCFLSYVRCVHNLVDTETTPETDVTDRYLHFDQLPLPLERSRVKAGRSAWRFCDTYLAPEWFLQPGPLYKFRSRLINITRSLLSQTFHTRCRRLPRCCTGNVMVGRCCTLRSSVSNDVSDSVAWTDVRCLRVCASVADFAYDEVSYLPPSFTYTPLNLLVLGPFGEFSRTSVSRNSAGTVAALAKITPRRCSKSSLRLRRNERAGENGRSPRTTRRPTASSGTIPTYEAPVTRPGIEPGSPSSLTAHPP
ncbi:hypothetical protein PR048_007873 [Dryococelus australis]|uniref:Uncharacterized protein n=1 Tax=Dryococelus australis TaxID=614101 RepID=A0ABQ9HX40_9NEOP|nr:hypothetical protein PR048_007873 [Dryococelus australis]